MAEATENLELLIEKLKHDGIEAGLDEGKKAKESAEREAEQIIANAQEKAKSIIEEAEAQARQKVLQGKSELQLAARDVVLGLKQAINKTVSVLVREHCENRLNDASFVGGLIKDVVDQYVRADVQGKNPTVIISDSILPVLRDSILAELSARDGASLVAGLKEAGFDFISSSGTIEITTSSVTEAIAQYVNASIQELLNVGGTNN